MERKEGILLKERLQYVDSMTMVAIAFILMQRKGTSFDFFETLVWSNCIFTLKIL